MADSGIDVQPASVPPHQPGLAPRKTRSGCRTVVLLLLIVFVVCVAAGSAGAWYWWHQSSDEGNAGRCFPAGPDGPLDTSHGVVSCSHPNAIWQITEVIDGRYEGNVTDNCGPDGDALIYIADEDQSYCLDYIN